MGRDTARIFRQGVDAARWLLAPMYLGLALLLVVLLIQFVRDFFQALPGLLAGSSAEGLPVILALAAVPVGALLVLTVIRTGLDLYAPGTAEEDPGSVDFRRLCNRLLAGSMALALLLLLGRLAGGALPEPGAPGEVGLLLGVVGALILGTLLLAVADWFVALARARAPRPPGG